MRKPTAACARLRTGGTGAAGTPGTSLTAGRTLWFQSIGTVNANSPMCLGHQQDNSATCPTAATPSFIYDYEVVGTGTLNSLWATSSVVAGAGNAWTVDVLVRRAGVSTSQMSCTISGATQRTCEATGAFALLAGDRVEVQISETLGNPPNASWKTYVTVSSVA